MTFETIARQRCFDGWQLRCRHRSDVLDCDMTFAVFVPPQAEQADARLPVLYWLSGLTCTDENFTQKAGAQRIAAELGIVIVCPDTSPRGPDVPADPEGAWDFGLGAGFYVNGTEAPWNSHYRMHDYVVHELPALIEKNFPVSQRRGISGHSMGGQGALVCALRNPGRYRSVSAFAPISHPAVVPWGEKALSRFLGENRDAWKSWDACELMSDAAERLPLLVDQGADDSFLQTQLKPELLQAAALASCHPLQLNLRVGYDHSYYFIASFIVNHLRHHAAALMD